MKTTRSLMKSKKWFNCIPKTTAFIFLSLSFFIVKAETITKTYSVKAFEKLRIGSAFEVEFIYSDENKVIIEIDSDEAEDVFVGNTADELIIKMKDYTFNNSSVMKAKVYAKTINALKASGATKFSSNTTFSGTNFKLNVSGASKVDISIDSKDLIAELSGASKVFLKGKAVQQHVELSGASKYDAKKCKSETITIEASGASKASIDCTDSLTVDASGASHVTYVQKPKQINQDVSGASEVEQE